MIEISAVGMVAIVLGCFLFGLMFGAIVGAGNGDAICAVMEFLGARDARAHDREMARIKHGDTERKS